MTQMKKLILPIAILVLAVSCRERPEVVRDTIPLVKQIAADTVGSFSLVRQYGTAGTRGSIALIGEPEECLVLAAEFLRADDVDNIDGHPAQDRLPDFAGESFEVFMDEYNAPFDRMAESNPDSLREIAVKDALMALDTAAYVTAYDQSVRLRKQSAKVFVLASTLLQECGRFDIDTLFKMAGREALILTPPVAMVQEADRAGMAHVAVWAPSSAKPAYEAARRGANADIAVLSPAGGDLRNGFRDLLRQYRTSHPNTLLDAVILDSFTADLEELDAELTHIRRQITEEDASFDRILSPDFRFIEPKKSLTSSCYRLLREHNLFTHNISYPSARYFVTEEGPDGDYLPVEIGKNYLSERVLDLVGPHSPAVLYFHVPDSD